MSKTNDTSNSSDNTFENHSTLEDTDMPRRYRVERGDRRHVALLYGNSHRQRRDNMPLSVGDAGDRQGAW